MGLGCEGGGGALDPHAESNVHSALVAAKCAGRLENIRALSHGR
jgi:hypothetical protein